MARLKGLGSFLFITAIMLIVLRGLHAGVPLFVADARPGPFTFADLGDVEPRLGFAPLVPAYRPARLGDRPARIDGWFAPEPTVIIEWRGDGRLAITQQRGGRPPDGPPTAQPLSGVAGSRWWQDGPTAHLILERDGIWLAIETDLPVSELRRLADTMTPY